MARITITITDDEKSGVLFAIDADPPIEEGVKPTFAQALGLGIVEGVNQLAAGLVAKIAEQGDRTSEANEAELRG